MTAGKVKYKTIFLILFFLIQTFAQIDNGEKSFSLHYNNQPLTKALSDIQKHANVVFIYDNNLINGFRISGGLDLSDIKKTVSLLLKDKPVDYKFFNDSTIVLYKKINSKTKPRPVIIKKTEKPSIPLKEKFRNVNLLTKAEPDYPPLAVQSGIEGEVTVKIFVSESGKVIKVKINKSSGYLVLDSAAVDYSKKLRFKPARQNGNPVPAWTKITF